MKCRFAFSLLLLWSSVLSGQSLNADYVASRPDQSVQWQSINLHQYASWSYQPPKSAHATVSLMVAYQSIKGLKYQTCHGSTCTEWAAITPDDHVLDVGLQDQSAKTLIFLNNAHDKIFFAYDDLPIDGTIKVALRYFTDDDGHEASYISNRNCSCTPLSYQSRTQWHCPDTEETSLYAPEYTQHTHIVIHHQAGSANPPYDNTVKAIWDYHVNGNGWSDIGYNWLIAPDGTIYKGRSWLNGDQNVRGAHTCACNSNKLGICLLGDLTSKLPTAAQYQSLKDFVVWKACELGILPDATDSIVSSKSGTCIDEYMHHITGHRDNCGAGYTACPGDKFYPTLQQLKNEVIDQYNNCIDTLNTGIHLLSTPINSVIYPNPNDGNFYIEASSPSILTIYNALCQVVSIYNLHTGYQYINTALPSGIYPALLMSTDDIKHYTISVRN